MDQDLETYFNEALALVKIAGDIIREKTKSRNTSASLKSCEIDLVTETDKQVEDLLVSSLGKLFPQHKFIGEESFVTKCTLTDDPTWIIDPIDGTMNFVHCFPHSCISLGLFINREPVIGIVYNPVLEQLFTAKKGQGAFCNGVKMNVSKEEDLGKALVMMENGTSRDEERMKVLWENQKTLIPIVHGTRSLGSAALDIAMVAQGCADAYFECGVHIWDIAAGELLVTEAGGVVIDPAGGELDRLSRRVLCANSMAMAQKLAERIVQYYPEPRD